MRNVTGSPVEHEDFFERPREIARLQRHLTNGANILLTAPRRVGKTSLVLRLAELERENGRSAVFLNVEGCHDELAFAEKLVEALGESGLHPEPIGRLSLTLRKVRHALGGVKIGTAGVDLDIGAGDEQAHGTLGRAVESIFRKIDAGDKTVLLIIDEIPELLLAMSRAEEGSERVTRLLHWLRALRQEHRKNIRWLFLGSIGLDNFVDDRRLQKAINDLTTLNVEALSAEEADLFLERLGESNGLPLNQEQRATIIERVGWPLPHHLQIVFHALVDTGATIATAAAIENAFVHLLQPNHLGQFDTWRHRLDEQFTPAKAKAARDILGHLCQHGEGRQRAQILNALMSSRAGADPQDVENLLSSLLMMLQRDGYLLASDDRYTFRSFLLRQYWYQREIR